MDLHLHLITIVLTLVSLLLSLHALRSLSRRNKHLPPGPVPLPIIGNLHLLGKHPHKSLTHLARTYGPIMFLRLGFRNALVISSAYMAKQVLQKHDLAFSGRITPDAICGSDNYKHSVVWLPVSPQWRNLRKILNSNIFSVNRLDANQHLRRKKVHELVESCRKSGEMGEAVDLGRAAFRTSLNLVLNMIFSRDWPEQGFGSGKEMKDLVGDVMVEIGRPNLVDCFPILHRLDPQGIRRRTSIILNQIFTFLNHMTDERIEKRNIEHGEGSDENVIDVLLTISKERPEEFGRIDIETMCTDLFTAGTETTSTALEWAMTEALRNPETIRKAKDELHEVIGERKILDEEDVARLPYLQCMVKETLRLHPPVPFAMHLAEQDVNVCGYSVSNNTQVIVNLWAIGRDAETWADPLEFRPERFVGSEIDVRGRDFELIPFGAGRRICPGLPLAMRMVSVMLGSLLNSFDWKLEKGISPGEIDMEEKFGVTLQKAIPLNAIPVLL